MPPSRQVEVEIEGKKVTLSNLDKVLYPDTGFRKAQVLDYYRKIAPVLLPHLRDRPITLKRYPEGVDRAFFYEKQCPAYRPPWVSVSQKRERSDKTLLSYCLVNDLPTLIWIANLASIEFHPLLSRNRAPEVPTMMVFDLDPGAPATILDCAKIAFLLKKMLAGRALECFAKTSGNKGIHLAVPLNTKTTFDATKALSRALAEELEEKYPSSVTHQMKKALRPGKVFIDWSQNSATKTTVCPYSLRAKDRPSASTPLDWKELEAVLKKKDAKALSFSPEDVLKRVEKRGDLWAEVQTMKQKMPKR